MTVAAKCANKTIERLGRMPANRCAVVVKVCSKTRRRGVATGGHSRPRLARSIPGVCAHTAGDQGPGRRFVHDNRAQDFRIPVRATSLHRLTIAAGWRGSAGRLTHQPHVPLERQCEREQIARCSFGGSVCACACACACGAQAVRPAVRGHKARETQGHRHLKTEAGHTLAL